MLADLFYWVRNHFELLFWTIGLTILFFVNPSETHFTLCLFKNSGIDFCPGCNLGKSIAYFFNGEFEESIKAHFFGIPAVVIIFHRVWILLTYK